MRIEALSIKSATIAIFTMIGVIAIILSLLAGSYFRQAALGAQIDSLSRVIEVASQEMLKEVSRHTFDLGMKLGHSKELIQAVNSLDITAGHNRLVELLDDPFVNGFVGFSKIDLEKIRIYNLELELISQSSAGTTELDGQLSDYLTEQVSNRKHNERLKAIDALWISSDIPLYSTLVPLGGLRPIGYLEIIINPVFNLPDIGKITKTPVNTFSITGELINHDDHDISHGYLPVEFTLHASNGEPAFRIVGYENVDKLNRKMEETQIITISGFLLLSLGTLLFALRLFNRFLFAPLSKMILDMEQITHGKLDLTVNNKGLREFHVLADAFNSMSDQVRMRTNDLERLLDMDDSAIMCFDHDKEAVYFNRAATGLLGYSDDEIIDLDLTDLFSNDIAQLMKSSAEVDTSGQRKLHTLLGCKHKDGHEFKSNAVINCIDVMGQSGYAIALDTNFNNKDSASAQGEQRLDAVEQSLSSLLEFARNNPELMSGLGAGGQFNTMDTGADTRKALLREQAVNVMGLALTCWERDLGKTKLELAEDSKIWPVYIDKSTPTTRTLDKYLKLDSCPKNPRNQRVIDTAEFVLRKMSNRTTVGRKKLQQALDAFRQLLAGMKSAAK
jgi:PAS domain S-box-containing protein